MKVLSASENYDCGLKIKFEKFLTAVLMALFDYAVKTNWIRVLLLFFEVHKSKNIKCLKFDLLFKNKLDYP